MTIKALIRLHMPTRAISSGGSRTLVAARDRAPEANTKRWNAVRVLRQSATPGNQTQQQALTAHSDPRSGLPSMF